MIQFSKSGKKSPWTFLIQMEQQRGEVYCADISSLSVFAGEKEVLFYPNTGFLVDKIDIPTQSVYLIPVDTLQVEERRVHKAKRYA